MTETFSTTGARRCPCLPPRNTVLCLSIQQCPRPFASNRRPGLCLPSLNRTTTFPFAAASSCQPLFLPLLPLGTTTSITFVHDELFPLILRELDAYFEKHKDSDALYRDVDALRSQVRNFAESVLFRPNLSRHCVSHRPPLLPQWLQDEKEGVKDAVAIPEGYAAYVAPGAVLYRSQLPQQHTVTPVPLSSQGCACGSKSVRALDDGQRPQSGRAKAAAGAHVAAGVRHGRR